mmetsp:Transcript_62272/g.56144  ORF Transcript_62272/g.56144 Transcript_62272/m.56144 type:complete len:971 (+) Transcript_62272:74-2986(+)
MESESTVETTEGKSNDSSKDQKENAAENAEDEAFMAKERERLNKELQQRKNKTIKVLTGCIFIESVLIAIYINSSSGVSFENLLDMYHDTLDCSLSIVLRLISLYIFTMTAIKFGTSKYYEKNKDLDKDESQSIELQAKLMQFFLSIWYRMIKYVSKTKIHDSSTISKDNKTLLTYDPKQMLNKYKSADPNDVADFWKNTIWLILFGFISMFEGYIGIKTVFFVTSNYWIHFLFGFSILLTHFEMYWVKKYIDDSTEPDNKLFDAHIHGHALFPRNVNGNWCDLCWTKLEKTCYRCDKCDFDICLKCWKKERKAKLLATREDVTGYEYCKRLLDLYGTHWIALVVIFTIVWMTSFISIRLPASRGELFDYIFEVNLDNFYYGLKIYIILNVIQAILNAINNILDTRIQEKVYNEVQKALYERILKQDMSYFDNSTSSVLVERLEAGLDDVLSPFLSLSSSVISNSIALIGSFYFCWIYSYRLLILAFSTLGPMTYLTILFRKWHNVSRRAVWHIDGDIWRYASESFKNIRTVRSYSKEKSMKNFYDDMRNELHNRKLKGSLMSALNNTVRSWFNLASNTLIIWAGGILVFQYLQQKQSNNDNDILQDLLTLGELITFERYWNKLKNAIFALQRQYSRFETAKFMAKHIFRLLDSDPKIEYIQLDKDKEKRIEIDDINGDIVFDNVHFHYYTEPNKKVLKGINLRIPKGKTTAFVGRSGGGKTTLINLIQRFYDPTKGKITIDNTNIRDIDVYSLREKMGVVSQGTQLFAKSIMHNIAFSVDEFTQEKLERCSKLANAHDFIQKFDDKYECKIGEDGTKLSGGQQQRVSIARMLMKKPSLMILDEATSSLDAESEALVQAALDIAIKDQESTVLLIAHRLSTVIDADQIVVIDDGTVIECGTHLELIEKNGLYAKLVNRQLNLQKRMEEKANNIEKKKKKNGNEDDQDGDNIDALIEQIRKDNEINLGSKT